MEGVNVERRRKRWKEGLELYPLFKPYFPFDFINAAEVDSEYQLKEGKKVRNQQ